MSNVEDPVTLPLHYRTLFPAINRELIESIQQQIEMVDWVAWKPLIQSTNMHENFDKLLPTLSWALNPPFPRLVKVERKAAWGNVSKTIWINLLIVTSSNSEETVGMVECAFCRHNFD